jgi:flagellar biosynthetic protein FliR
MVLEQVFTTNAIYSLLFPFIRIIGLLVSMPFIGTKLVPTSVKIILAMALTLFAYPIITEFYIPPETYSWIDLVLIGTGQFLVGVLMGFLIQILFQAFILAGQIIAMQMGLGFASMMDPGNGVSVPAVGQIYLLMVTLMYLSVDGHMFLFATLGESFRVIPISIAAFESLNFNHVFSLISWMFSMALKIVLPAVIALLLVNISLGIMTKAAPQLNIFSIGFPLTMILGMIIIYLTLFYLVPHFTVMTDFIHNHVLEVANGT